MKTVYAKAYRAFRVLPQMICTLIWARLNPFINKWTLPSPMTYLCTVCCQKNIHSYCHTQIPPST